MWMLNEVEGVLCSNRKVIMFGQRWWDEESSGEVSEGQRPVLTEAQERVVMGHSFIPQHQSVFAEQSHHATLSSPGQSQIQHTGTHTHTSNWSEHTTLQHIPMLIIRGVMKAAYVCLTSHRPVMSCCYSYHQDTVCIVCGVWVVSSHCHVFVALIGPGSNGAWLTLNLLYSERERRCLCSVCVWRAHGEASISG